MHEDDEVLEHAVHSINTITDSMSEVMKLQIKSSLKVLVAAKETTKASCAITMEQYILTKLISYFMHKLNVISPRIKTKIQNELINHIKSM
jgi:phage-related minor tail protein